MYWNKKIKWFTLCGAVLWIATGLVLSFRPAGYPPTTFRKSADLMPLLALGLALIGVSVGIQLQSFRKTGGRVFTTACWIMILSSLSYALGVGIRHAFLQANGWEPFMPLGFLGFIISWMIAGVVSLKKGLYSRLSSLLLIASAVSLLTFNDQFNPYSSIVFGVLTLCAVLTFEQSSKQSQRTRFV